MWSSRKQERWLTLPLWFSGTALGLFALRHTALPLLAGACAVAALTFWLLLLRRQNRIPVLNYHSVTDDTDWLLPLGEGLATRPAHLEAQLEYLRKEGVDTLFISEVADALRSCTHPGNRRVALTFDDGFADAWHTLLPLLQTYGAKATLFVNPAMIEPGDTPGTAPVRGYLNQAELLALHRSGHVEIQPHGLRHDRLPTREPAPTASGSTRTVWKYMRHHPDHPWSWHHETGFTQGTYEGEAPALSEPIWLMDFNRMETPAEFEERVVKDLREAKSALNVLVPEHPVMCWPENRVPANATSMLKACGYQASISNRFPGLNRPGVDAPEAISRVSVPDVPDDAQLSFWTFQLTLRVWEGTRLYGPLLGLLLWRAKKRRTHSSKRNPPPEPSPLIPRKGPVAL